jgi:hypothetical protein
MLGCWASEVDRASRTTVLIDEQFASLYTHVNDICVQRSADWAAYDECIDPWKKEAANVARLREVTLALDIAKGRKARKAAACEWFRAVENTHRSLPARTVALQAVKWRRKC